jgi:hypothetical protein
MFIERTDRRAAPKTLSTFLQLSNQCADGKVRLRSAGALTGSFSELFDLFSSSALDQTVGALPTR